MLVDIVIKFCMLCNGGCTQYHSGDEGHYENGKNGKADLPCIIQCSWKFLLYFLTRDGVFLKYIGQ